MKNLKYIFLTIILFSNLIIANDQIPGRKQNKPIALTNAKIVTVTNGIIENGTLVFENGKITSVGKNIEIPINAEIINCENKFVYPGLMNSLSAVGLVEIGAVRATRDITEVGKFNPNVRAEITLNPDSELLSTIRANGILLANVHPRGNLISGKSSVIMLDGWTQEDLVLKSETSMYMEWPEMRTLNYYWMQSSEEEQKKEREKKLSEIKEFFNQAKKYKTAIENNNKIKKDLKLEAMINVLNKKTPLIIFANEILQIESALEFCENENVNLILAGARDSWMILEKLKSRNIPVLIDQIYALPERDWEKYDVVYSLPKKLLNAGIKFSISSDYDNGGERNLPYQAASCIPFGLSKEDALKSITINPAEIFGVSDKVGSIEVGKDATIFISSGDILEITSQVEVAFIQGKKVDLSSRHTKLFSKYKEKYKQLGIIK